MVPDMYLGTQGLLVRRSHTSKVLNLTRPRPFIQSFRIPLLRYLHRHVDEDLHKRQTGLLVLRPAVGRRFVERPRRLAIFPVGRDKRRDGNGVAVSKQLGDLADTPDVFVTVRFAEAKILV